MNIHLVGNSRQRRTQLRRIIRVLQHDEFIEQQSVGQYHTNLPQERFERIFYVRGS